MPLLVARQWPVVTRAPAALASRRPALRSYAAPPPLTVGFHQGPRRERINGGIIIPDSVHTQPHQLFESIKPLSSLHAPRRTFAVFFVTPSYAQFLLDDDAFLRTALRRMYKEAIGTPGLTISALCAVVDKLPAPQPWNARTLESQLSRRRTDPPVAGTGFEGIAYASLPVHASVPSDESLSPSEQGAVDFITADRVSMGEGALDTLRLPLANTVFQTGMPTTMFHSSWKTDGTTGELTRIAKTTPSRHAIRLVEKGQASDIDCALNIPLLPLTLPRVVEGCMGNIIRRVIDADGKSIQASSELENVVPRFFSSRNQPAQATVAWALVIPRDLKNTIGARTEELLASLSNKDSPNSTSENAWERLWRCDPPVWNTLVSQALSEGARLHRVLSGGGGWGKKAGLLSLDPVPANKPLGSPTGPDSPALIDNVGDFESTLTPVVQDGDSVQFFTLPKSDLAQEARESDNYETVSKLPSVNESEGWELGTIPSTMDSIPGESWQHMGTENHRATLFQGSFGALTEGALTITRRRWKQPGTISSVYTTTLDVPFSRFWAVNPAQSHDSLVGHGDIEQVAKDRKPVPDLNKLSSSSSRNFSDSFSSTALTQESRPENAILEPKNSIADIEWLQPAHEKLGIAESQKNCSKVSPGANDHSSSLPKLTVSELVHALDITGFSTFGRLTVRTAKVIMRKLNIRFNQLRYEYEAIISGRRRGTFRRNGLQSARFKPGSRDKKQEQSFTRRLPVEQKGTAHTRLSVHKTGKTATKLDHTTRSKDNTRRNKPIKPPTTRPKDANAHAPRIRKYPVQTKPTLDSLSKTFRTLVIRVLHLSAEASARILVIRLRRPRPAPQDPKPKSKPKPRRQPRKTRSRRRRRTKRFPHRRHRRPRIRRITAPVPIKLHPSFPTGTIRYPDGRRARLRRRVRRAERGAVLKKVAVASRGAGAKEGAVGVKRREESGRVDRRRRQRRETARRLVETVGEWLGGFGSGG